MDLQELRLPSNQVAVQVQSDASRLTNAQVSFRPAIVLVTLCISAGMTFSPLHNYFSSNVYKLEQTNSVLPALNLQLVADTKSHTETLIDQ